MKDLSKFITNAPQKTRPMTVMVFDKKLKRRDSYEAPAGFQLDRYVAFLNPACDLKIYGDAGSITVEVMVGDFIVETHAGLHHD